MELAQARKIDAVLVTEMTRWGRSTQDLMDTLGQLASWDVSLIAQTGLTFDLSTPQGKLITNLMASLAEFEHDLLRERVRSGVTAAKARGQTFGRRHGYQPSDKQAPKVVELSEVEGLSQREIAGKLGLSKTTVNEILKRSKQSHDGSRSLEAWRKILRSCRYCWRIPQQGFGLIFSAANREVRVFA